MMRRNDFRSTFKCCAALAAAGLTLAACGGVTPLLSSNGQTARTVTVTQSMSSTTAYAPSSPTLTATGPRSSIDTDGTYLIGVDVFPGVYRTMGGTSCYWARLSSLNTNDIIDNNNSSGPQVVEILATDRAFLTHNCQPWNLVASPTQPAIPAPASGGGGSVIASLPGADTQGFANGPRCAYQAALLVRTALSQAVVCTDANGTYTYKGLRLKDNGRIDLEGALPTANGFTVSNTDGTRYDISRSGLVITSPTEDVYTEQAIAAGP